MKLIVGLGNPGRGYASSLHNMGFMCLGHFARIQSVYFKHKQANARVGIGEVAGNEVILARPHTYMNQSGQAVSRLVKKYRVGLEDLVVIHDDLDIPLGKIRIRPDGSSAGHKGVESIIGELGSQDFQRIRVGIGRPIATDGLTEVTDADIITYLLSDLPDEEKQALNHVLPVVSEAIFCLITDGLTAAMNKYN